MAIDRTLAAEEICPRSSQRSGTERYRRCHFLCSTRRLYLASTTGVIFPLGQPYMARVRLWQKWGVWQRVHDCLRTKLREKMGKKPQASAAILDSQSVKTTEKRGKCTALMSPTKTKGRKRFAKRGYFGLGTVVRRSRSQLPRALGRCSYSDGSSRGGQNQSGATLGRPRLQWPELCTSGQTIGKR